MNASGIDPPPVVVLLEGASDVAAVAALLAAARVPDRHVRLIDMGGVTNVRRDLAAFREPGRARRVLGLCDEREAPVVYRALIDAGAAADGEQRAADYGFHVCHADLEDELISSLGPEQALALVDGLGLRSRFDGLSGQLAWRDTALAERLHRFAGVASGRKIMLAGAMASALPTDRLPPPLAMLVSQIRHAVASDDERPLEPLRRFDD